MGLFFFRTVSRRDMSKVNVIILGKPGAGKSTASQRLSEQHDLENIDFGKYLRTIASADSLLGRYVKTFWSRNNLKEIGFEYFDQEFRRCLEQKRNFVLSSPKVLSDAQEIDEQLNEHKLQVDAVVELNVSSDVCVDRVNLKKSQEIVSPQRDDDEDSESLYPVEMRIENFEKHISELREYYKAQPHVEYLSIDASQDIDQVINEIVAKLEKIERKPADYSHLSGEREEVPEDEEEASDEFFVRINGSRRAELVQLMLDLANNPKPKIPLTHPVPLYGQNIDELKNRQYAIIRKLNGVRRLLIVHENQIYAVSQQYNVFRCVGLSLPESPSQDWNQSLFDAEIVCTNAEKDGKRSLFILDCLCASGKNVRSEKLATRLTHVKSFSDDFKDMDKDISVFAQVYYTLSQLPLLTKLGRNGDPTSPVPSARCTADGLLFVPTTLRYNIGCSRFLLSWKPVVLNTMDLAAFKETNEEGTPVLVLKSFNHKESSYRTCGQIEPIPKNLEDLQDGTVVECNWKDDKWSVQKIRKDRAHPNADWVVNDAIEQAKQPVSPKMLLEKVQSILLSAKKTPPATNQSQNRNRSKQGNRRF